MIYISGTPAEISEFLASNHMVGKNTTSKVVSSPKAKNGYVPVPANPIRDEALALEAKNRSALKNAKVKNFMAYKQMQVARQVANESVNGYWEKRLADAKYADNWLNGSSNKKSVSVKTMNSPSKVKYNSDKNAAYAALRAARRKISSSKDDELSRALGRVNYQMDKDLKTYPKGSEIRVWHKLDFAFDWLKTNTAPKATGIGSAHVNAAKANGSI